MNNGKVKLHFLGGAKMVDGSCYMLECEGEKILIDCGLHQGESYELNKKPLPFNPSEIKAVAVTHAHIDHTGRLPLLYKNGFRGKIYSTPPTKDFADIMLVDAYHVMEDERTAEKEALYDLKDLQKTMELWEAVEYHQELKISEKFSLIFYNAGHILGSSIIMVMIRPEPGKEGKIVFSGDLGNPENRLLPETEVLSEGDYCLIESTYGNRLHEEPEKRKDMFEDIIEETALKEGVLMIPAFAMERTQELLFELNQLVTQGRVPKQPVFIDSPLAIRLTEVYKKYPTYFRLEAFKQINGGSEGFFDFPGLHFTLTVEESKSINEVPAPKIIMAGSGSSQGGRIQHHEKRYLPDPNSTLLVVGYQMSGSLGRKISEGEKVVYIHGEKIDVRARIALISGYSAHADQTQLLDWIKPMRFTLKKAFVVQGDPEASETLALKMRDLYGINAVVPEYLDVVDLTCCED